MYAILSLTFIIKCWIRWKSCSIKIQRCNSTRRITTFNKRPTLLSNSSQIQRLQKETVNFTYSAYKRITETFFFPLLRIYTFEQIALPSVSTSTSRHTILFWVLVHIASFWVDYHHWEFWAMIWFLHFLEIEGIMCFEQKNYVALYLSTSPNILFSPFFYLLRSFVAVL